GTDEMRAALQRIARWVLEHGVDGGRLAFDPDYRAGRDLLLRRPPRRTGTGPLRGSDEPSLEAAIRVGLELDHGTLAIQGPPGSGKTYAAARMIVALVRAGKRVGVTANSHKVIGNALDMIHKEARKANVPVRIGQRHANDAKPTSPIATPLGSNAEA